MSGFSTGDLVTLISGSMRMAVEAIDGDRVAVVWCHEGEIGRDNFDARLLKKWEYREDHGRDNDRGDRGRPHRGDRDGGGRPYRGDRDGGGHRGRDDDRGHRGGRDDDRGHRGRDDDRGHRGRDDDRGPRGKTGWDGKPREKKYFRKDD